MLDGIVVPIFQAAYTFLHFIATILWGLNQAMLLVGYYLMALTDWLINSAFSPLLTQVINQTGGLLAPIFTIAMLVLAITYFTLMKANSNRKFIGVFFKGLTN